MKIPIPLWSTITGLFMASVVAQAALPLQKIRLPPGFEIQVLTRVKGARSLAMSPSGTLFISTREEGKVYAFKNGKLYTLARHLDEPNGIDFHDGALYIAEVSRITQLPGIEGKLSHPPAPEVVVKNLPQQKDHGWRYMRFSPTGKLTIAIGAPCNECLVHDPFGTILEMNPSGSNRRIIARGVRNSVGFDWDPKTHDLWFTDNGRDWMGNDRPPDELNHLSREGENFGYPYCHGGEELDPKFGKGHRCSEFVPPVVKIPAHDAALGMRFYTGKNFPKGYRGNIFIAEHGSWNREPPRGYRISRIVLTRGKPPRYEIFAQGWLQGTKEWGRPVDVLVAHDGSLLVSDDYAGAVYRIRFSGERAGQKRR